MWIIQLLLSLFAITGVFQIGFLVDYFLLARNKSSGNLFIFYALGLGTVACFQLLISFLGIPLNRYMVLVLTLVSFFPLFISIRLRKKLAEIFSELLKSVKNLHPAIFFLMLVFLAIIIIFSFSRLIWGYDAWGFWLSKARAFWIDGRVTRDNLYLYWPYDHPILWPLVSTWFYHILGEQSLYWVRIIPFFTYISLAGAFCCFLPNRNKWKLGWIIILALTPFVWGQVVFVEYAGNADLLVSFFLLAAIATLIKRIPIYSSLFLGFAVLTKNDILPASVFFTIVFSFVVIFSKKKKEYLTALLITAGFLLFDMLWKNYYGLTNRYQQQNLNIILAGRPLFKYIWYTLHAFREELRNTANWGLGWWLIIFSFLTNFKKIWQNRWVTLAFLLLAIQFISFIWIYYITPENPAEHITTSIFRLLLQLYPSMLFLSYTIWFGNRRLVK